MPHSSIHYAVRNALTLQYEIDICLSVVPGAVSVLKSVLRSARKSRLLLAKKPGVKLLGLSELSMLCLDSGENDPAALGVAASVSVSACLPPSPIKPN